MNPLTEIISKLEKATGPSRYLDAEIAAAVGLDTGMFIWDGQRNFVGVQNNITVPHYTSSIDSALMLVPKNSFVTLHIGYEASEALVKTPPKDHFEWSNDGGESKTPALSLCIASLKAIAALRSRSGDK